MKTIDFRKKIFMNPTIFDLMIYPVCNVLDMIINASLNKGIKSVKHDEYCLYIEFKDNTKAEFWNAGKYDAWLSEGYIGDYSWVDSRPKKSTMRRLRYELEEYYKTNKNEWQC